MCECLDRGDGTAHVDECCYVDWVRFRDRIPPAAVTEASEEPTQEEIDLAWQGKPRNSEPWLYAGFVHGYRAAFRRYAKGKP